MLVHIMSVNSQKSSGLKSPRDRRSRRAAFAYDRHANGPNKEFGGFHAAGFVNVMISYILFPHTPLPPFPTNTYDVPPKGVLPWLP